MKNKIIRIQNFILFALFSCLNPSNNEIDDNKLSDFLVLQDSLRAVENERIESQKLLLSLNIQMIAIDEANFAIGKYEVTQKIWAAIMGENPSEFECDDCPVTNVSWNDVQSFIYSLNLKTGRSFRLPSESEWDFAFRGGKLDRGFRYSGSNQFGEVALKVNDLYGNNTVHNIYPVGLKKPNQLGIYDMTGNVAEWCSDWNIDWDNTLKRHGDYWENQREKIFKWRAGESMSDNINKRENCLGFRLAESR